MFPSFQSILIGTATRRLEDSGCDTGLFTRPACFSGRPGRALEKLVGEIAIDAWLLFHAPPRVHRWFAKNRIPVGR